MVVPEKTKKSTEVFDGHIMKVFKDEIFLIFSNFFEFSDSKK